MHDWAYQWKMSINSDQAQDTQEVIFSRKTIKSTHPPLYFNNTTVKLTHVQKHLGLQLDNKLYSVNVQKIKPVR